MNLPDLFHSWTNKNKPKTIFLRCRSNNYQDPEADGFKKDDLFGKEFAAAESAINPWNKYLEPNT